MNIKVQFASLFLLVFFLGIGQEKKRLEFDLRDSFINEEVYPLQDNGLLIQSYSKKPSKGKIDLKNDFYSTDLKLLKSEITSIKSRTFIEDSYQKDNVNYTLIRNRRDYFAIVTSNIKTLSSTKVEGTYSNKGTMEDMVIVQDKAVFKSVKNKTSTIIIIDLKTGKVNEVPFKLDKIRRNKIKIKDFQVIDNQILVFINILKTRKTQNTYIAELDLNGSQQSFYPITDNLDENLITIAATKLKNKYILTGTFSRKRGSMSQGIFLSEIENKKANFIKFYNFLDLKNFINYLPEKKQTKIKNRKNRKAKKGYELLLNYNIATHPIKENEMGYQFLGEAFFPTYVYHSCGYMGRSICSQFTGFQYTHASLVQFDHKGDLIWDNTFEMYASQAPFYVKKFITMKNTPTSVDLVFSDRNKIKYKKINRIDGKSLIDKSQKIESYIENDHAKRSNSNIDYWYDDNFISYGTQILSNKTIKRKRKVFFVNKIKLNK